MSMKHGTRASTKTVVVLGASYGGCRVAQVLAAELPDGWKVLLIDRNSHMNHVYIMPRLAILPGHEHKAFIPYSNVFLLNSQTDDSETCPAPDPSSSSCHPLDHEAKEAHPHKFIQAQVRSLNTESITIVRSSSSSEATVQEEEEIPYDYLIYALGSKMPAPLDLWAHPTLSPSTSYASPAAAPVPGPEPEVQKRVMTPYGGSKAEGIEWLKRNQEIIRAAQSVLVVGGGALGIQFATDIAAIYPAKHVTLLHSRKQVLPRFNRELHTEVVKALDLHNVDTILGERLDFTSLAESESKTSGPKVVKTQSGREIQADLVLLCTGQAPNTSYMSTMDPRTVDPSTNLIHVLRTMQVAPMPPPSPPPIVKAWTCPDGATPPELDPDPDKDMEKLSLKRKETTPYSRMFAIGDAADAFGALKAGHNAYYQGEVAARNVLTLIDSEESSSSEDVELEEYVPREDAIKVSLGLTRSAFQVSGVVGAREDGVDDLGAGLMWPCFGATLDKDGDQ